MVDISGGMKAQFDTSLKRAQDLYAAGQHHAAAQEYERCARIMKELVSSAVSVSVQRQRLEKARQYLELAKRIRAGETVAVTSGELADDARQRQISATAMRSAVKTSQETESEEDFSSEIARLIQKAPVKWEQIGGLEQTKSDMRTAYALAAATMPQGVRLKTSRNLLLYGPPGTGKTLLAAAASNELAATFFNVKVSGILSKYFGESSKLVSALFTEARSRPASLIFFDEVDALAPSRSGNLEGAEKRLLSAFLSEMDGLESKGAAKFLFVIGATNMPWSVDNAILSRFGKLVYVPLPDEPARHAILAIQLEQNGLKCDAPADEMVRLTDGYSGRDIEKLCAEAAEIMCRAANPELSGAAQGVGGGRLRVRPISRSEFEEALRRIRPKSGHSDIDQYRKWAESSS